MTIQDTTEDSGFRFDNSYARLPPGLFTRQPPMPVDGPKMIIFNRTLAIETGLNPDTLDTDEGAAIFGGNRLPDGAQPIAMAYAGHQFGHFTNLGDGRAILLGEQITPDGRRLDIQLKGSGQTPYSRNGDGRAALGPMLREYLISEAMYALGIPTTRSLAVVATGEPVYREKALPGAVLTRVAQSHIRVGTFEYLSAIGNNDALRALLDYTLWRHFPEAAPSAEELLRAVLERQASLIAQWMLTGFIHGVMNTDNMALSGETIDYGPCAFMNNWNPQTVFSSIDLHGRYAYAQQPRIALWNLSRLANALLPLLHDRPESAEETALQILNGFNGRFEHFFNEGLRKKLALFNTEPSDEKLFDDLFTWMFDNKADFTQTFRTLCTLETPNRSPFPDPAFLAWYGRWNDRLSRQEMAREDALREARKHNPAIIPRNHLVEETLQAATENNDMTLFHSLLHALQHPFDETTPPRFTDPPKGDQSTYRTFCGT